MLENLRIWYLYYLFNWLWSGIFYEINERVILFEQYFLEQFIVQLKYTNKCRYWQKKSKQWKNKNNVSTGDKVIIQ